jgi:hypothetical protein
MSSATLILEQVFVTSFSSSEREADGLTPV